MARGRVWCYGNAQGSRWRRRGRTLRHPAAGSPGIALAVARVAP